jgi:alpha-soluble NSF attachment protein
MGRLGMAARQLREIAETMEKDESHEEALMFYEQAADLFYTDHSTAESNKCLLKVAQFSAEAGNYSKAMDIYESVAKASVDNNLLRFSAKGHLLMACLCAMCCMSPSGVAETVEKYKNIDFNLEGSRELKLVEACVEAIEVGDAEGFTTAVAEYDSLTRLDAFKTELLVSFSFNCFCQPLCCSHGYIQNCYHCIHLQLRVKRKLIDSPTLDDEEDLT